MIFLSESFKEIFFHLRVIEGEVEIDIEVSEEDFAFEVLFVVELHGLFMIIELHLDDPVLGVDCKVLDFSVLFDVLEVHIDHFMLDGLLHVLDDQLLALLHFLLHCLLNCRHIFVEIINTANELSK